MNKNIAIKQEVFDILNRIGQKSQTYSDIIFDTIKFKEKFDNEKQFSDWFEINYNLLDIDKILIKNTRTTPDFIVLINGQEIKVELETLSSNFIKHGHKVEDVDLVICIIKDVELPVKTIELNCFDLKKREFKHLIVSEKTHKKIKIKAVNKGLTIDEFLSEIAEEDKVLE